MSSDNDVESEWVAAEVDRVVAMIRPLIARRHPGVQMGVVADLMALFIAGHHQSLREQMLDSVVAEIRELVPVNVVLLEAWRKSGTFDG